MNYKELYNALTIISVKSKELGVCSGECTACKKCINPLCTKLKAFQGDEHFKGVPMKYSITSPNPDYNSFKVLQKFCKDLPNCEGCIFYKDGEEYHCSVRYIPFTEFQVLAEKVRSKINE